MSIGLVPFPNNDNLLDYATFVLNNCHTPQLVPSDNIINLRSTALLGNSCVAPLVLTRGWGLLSLVADGKTKTSLEKAVAKILGCETEHLHGVMACATEKYRGMTCFFAEYSRSTVTNEERMKLIEKYYYEGGLKNLCFTCDHDGLRTMNAINRVVEACSEGRVEYAVRDEMAPNRRAMTVLVSAVNCTFNWRHPKPLQLGWTTKGFFHYIREHRTVIRLDSTSEGIHLILYMPSGNEVPTAGDVLEAGRHLSLSSKEISVFIPQIAVATPLSMRECSVKGKYNMKRVFDREKSELTGYLTKFHPFYPSLSTLWNHYHKVVFTIIPETPPLATARLQETERRATSILNEVAAQCYRYHEKSLSRPPVPSCQAGESADEALVSVAFTSPFYFLLVQNLDRQPLVHCFGRFTNADATFSAEGATV